MKVKKTFHLWFKYIELLVVSCFYSSGINSNPSKITMSLDTLVEP